MKVEKTVKARIWKPTEKKKKLLEKEYSNAQKYVSGETEELYSATKQAMDKYAGKNIREEKPLFLRNDTFRVEKAENTKEFDYWAKIPIHDYYGGIEVPVKPHENLEEYEIKDSKIVKKDDYFELHLSVLKEVEPVLNYDSVLAIDLGERTAMTAVLSEDAEPRFYGKNIRHIRNHYQRLRKKLQNKKLQDKISEIGKKESRKVEDTLHKISREIVELAEEENSLIVMGDLRDIEPDTESRRFNRYLSNWTQGKLQRMIEYKAKEKGILVVIIDERGTSSKCHRCGNEDVSRSTQGRFNCNSCGLRDYNADVNGAKNILERFSSYIEGSRASVTMPQIHTANIKTEQEVALAQ